MNMIIIEPECKLYDREETRADGTYVVYADESGIDVFAYNRDVLNTFSMTADEMNHGIKLCIMARMGGHWKGDILNPEPY